jgi:hypothetical protein
VQFLAELNDDDDDVDEDEDDEDDDAVDDEFEDEELDDEEPPFEVVWLAELPPPPHPAASTTSAVTEAIANACLMPSSPDPEWSPAPGNLLPASRPVQAYPTESVAGRSARR